MNGLVVTQRFTGGLFSTGFVEGRVNCPPDCACGLLSLTYRCALCQRTTYTHTAERDVRTFLLLANL